MPKNRSRARLLEAAMATDRHIPAYDSVASRGRFGDTELAHVNSREKALLMAMGGAGTRNPRTGLLEFYDASFSGGEQGSGQFGDNIGGGGLSMDTGGGYTSPGEMDQQLANEQAKGVTNPDYSTGGLGGGYTSPGEMDQQLANEQAKGVATPDYSTDGLGRGQGRGDAFSRAMAYAREQLDPRTQAGMFNAMTGLAPGFGLASRAAYGLAEALGGTLGRGLNDMFGGTAPAISFDYSDQSQGGGRNDDVMAILAKAQPVAEPLINPADPGGVPEEIGSFIGPGMSDLQQRALISTYGTQGVNSAFRTDPVKRYYARLLQRGLLENGRPAGQPYTLPIEHTYWQGVMGNPVENPGNAQSILSAIARYL